MIFWKVCMVGATGVGKTSLVRRFVESVFDERYLSTIAVKVDKKVMSIRGRQVTFMLWDLAGDDDVESIRSSYLRGSAGFVVVVDGTRAATLERARALVARIRAEVGDQPFVVALNKTDLEAEWEIDNLPPGQAPPREWTLVRTSAKTGSSVEALFASLGEKLLASL
jgi:hypothetical protein